MEIMVTKNDKEIIYGSDLHLLIRDLNVSAPSLEQNLTFIQSRNGQMDYGANHKVKTIHLTGWLLSEDMEKHMLDRDRLYAVFHDVKPYYLTELYEDDLYGFEQPGERTDFTLLERHCTKYAYRCRYFVRVSDEVKLSFVGRHQGGIVSEVEVSFQTVGLPYGESLPQRTNVVNEVITYKGTVPCSQLECPFTLQATALKDGENVTFSIEDRTLVMKGKYKKDDVFSFRGVENLQNEININEKTNYAYFVLQPSLSWLNVVRTNKPNDFTLEVLDYKYLYM